MSNLKVRDLRQDEVDYILNLKTDDITLELGRELFAYKKDKQPKFSPNDRMVIPKDSKFKNSSPIPTTVGRCIVNTFLFLEPNFIQHIGYVNDVLGKKGMGGIHDKLADLIVADKIKTSDFILYLNKAHFIGFAWNDFLATSVNMAFINPSKAFRREKKKVLDNHKEDFKDKYVDINKVLDVENELIGIAKNEMKDNPAIDIYNSGGRGSFENNFKKTSIMVGGNRELSDPSKFTVCFNNYAEGVEKKDLVTLGNDMIDGSYSRGVLTAKGGYLSKQLWAAYQTIRKPDIKDCGSTRYLDILITKDNAQALTYRYVKDGSKLVKTDLEYLKKNIGKTLKFRSPTFCKSKGNICLTCLGEFLEKLGIEDPGLVINRVGSKVMMGMMKKFHDKTVKTKKYKFVDYLEEVK